MVRGERLESSIVSVSFESVAKKFGTFEVFGDVSFSVDAPATIGLIGDNGSGKTTLLRLAAGILRPTVGAVRLLGALADRDHPGIMRRVGALIEKPGHYDELTVIQNLRYFFSFYAPREPRTSMDEVIRTQLDRFGLHGVLDQPVGQLSSGYRQRLALARAVHPWADVLLLDEPFESLDPRARSVVKQAIGVTGKVSRIVFLSSHALVDVDQICDEIFLIAAHRLHRFRSFDEIQQRLGGVRLDDLDAVYMRLTEQLMA